MISENIQQIPKQTKASLLKMSDPGFYGQKMPADVQQHILEAKRRDRPDLGLHQWDQHSYFKTNVIKGLMNCQDTIERVSIQSLSYADFAQRSIKGKEPVIIKDCTNKWANPAFWAYDYLTTHLAHCKFKVGEDDDGNKIKLSFYEFMQYLIRNTDDSPLYLFENITIPNKENEIILQSYTVPQLFTENLLELLEPADRPAFKWFLVGPERSGSGIHVDPILTCAWNTSIIGRKRWVIFDGKIAQSIATGKQFKKEKETDEAIDYFLHILPQIKQKYNTKELGLCEFIQYPGETVFVPGGAWHAVLNLQDTVAVTQNFVSSVNFQEAWPSFMKERGELVIKMLKQLQIHNHQLYEKVASLSKESSQWRQMFGNKFERQAKFQQQIVEDDHQLNQIGRKRRRSFSSSKGFQKNQRQRNSHSAKKQAEVFKDQQWFQ